MSKQTMNEIYAPIEGHYKSIVMHKTFGHLFPDGTHYEGSVRVSQSIYGSIVVLDEQIDIAASPWWFNAINTFASKMSEDMEAGDVCEFKIKVEIVNHCEADKDNDPEHPEDDVFDEHQTIEIFMIEKNNLVAAY